MPHRDIVRVQTERNDLLCQIVTTVNIETEVLCSVMPCSLVD